MLDQRSETPQSLATLVNADSVFIFFSLGITKQNREDCFSLPPEHWETQSCFKFFKEFCQTLTVVSVPAERAIGMMQSFVEKFEPEEKKTRLFGN